MKNRVVLFSLDDLVLRHRRRQLLDRHHDGVHLLVRTTEELKPPFDVLRVEEKDALVGVGEFRVRFVEGGVVGGVAEVGLEGERGLVGGRRRRRGRVENALPDARRPFPRPQLRSLPLRVEEERPTPTDVRLPDEEAQQLLVPFEPVGVLPLDLVDAVEELLEDRARLLERVTRRRELPRHRRKERLLGACVVSKFRDKVDAVVAEVAGTVGEAVAVRDPVLLDEDGQTPSGAEERVEAELRKGGELRGAVPAVGAVDEGVRVVEVYGANDDEDAVEDVGKVGEPPCSAESDAVESTGRFGVDES
jgi:hypothetical protein